LTDKQQNAVTKDGSRERGGGKNTISKDLAGIKVMVIIIYIVFIQNIDVFIKLDTLEHVMVFFCFIA
jgi:hypothetical protein